MFVNYTTLHGFICRNLYIFCEHLLVQAHLNIHAKILESKRELPYAEGLILMYNVFPEMCTKHKLSKSQTIEQ